MYGNLGGMEKTTVYLTGEQKAALARAARSQGRSEAHVIRSGIDVMTGGHRAGDAPAALARDVPGDDGGHAGAPSLDRPRWIAREAFVGMILRNQADSGLGAELRDIAPGTTEDEPLP